MNTNKQGDFKEKAFHLLKEEENKKFKKSKYFIM